MTSCVVDDCNTESYCREMCQRHYRRNRLYGSPDIILKPTRDMSPWDRIVLHGWTTTESGCWEYRVSAEEQGYGRVRYTAPCLVTLKAHRVSYEHHYGPISQKEVVRHFVCDNPPCINPDHLRAGSVGENNDDKMSRGREARTVSVDETRTIRDLYRSGEWTQVALAGLFRISTSRVSQIVNGRFYDDPTAVAPPDGTVAAHYKNRAARKAKLGTEAS